MRDLAFAATLMSLLALAAARPFVGVLVWCWIGFMNPHLGSALTKFFERRGAV